VEFDQVVFSRRSVRAFTDRDVTDEQVRQLIRYGHCAPSGGNLREWVFIVVRSWEGKRALTECTFQGNNHQSPPQRWIETAPVVIAVAADRAKVRERYGETELDCLPYLDCSAAVQNMLLGAVNLGLASCYISGFRKEELHAALALPNEFEPIALLPIGYAAQPGVERPHATEQEVTRFERYS
jgi:nitroreductase